MDSASQESCTLALVFFHGETKQDILRTGQTALTRREMSIEWVPGSGSNVPSNAVAGGLDRGARLYVARASHAGGLVPGKFYPPHKSVYVRWATMSPDVINMFSLLPAMVERSTARGQVTSC